MSAPIPRQPDGAENPIRVPVADFVQRAIEMHPAPRCDCSLGWRFNKGNGPDPARCPVHGEQTP